MTSPCLPVAVAFAAALCLLVGCASPSTTLPSGPATSSASLASDAECPDVTRLRSAQLYGTFSAGETITLETEELLPLAAY